MKFIEFLNKNWYCVSKVILLLICAISLTKIAFKGIIITSLQTDILDVKLDEKSKINLTGNDLGLHDAPVWVHVETPIEYNKRLDNSIKAYEHDYKMKHDEKYRNEFNERYDKWKEEHNIK